MPASNNHQLLLEILKEVKKISLDIETLKSEVSYIKTTMEENNITIVEDSQAEPVQSWFWSS